MTLFHVRVLEKKPSPEASAMVGGGCLGVPALSALSNIPSPATQSEREEGAAALARIDETRCLHSWLLFCLRHEAAVSRAFGTCLVAHGSSHLALMSLQGPYLVH